MADYSGLVKRLRDVGEDYDFHENALIFDAAAAIEAQRERIERLEAEIETMWWWGDPSDMHEEDIPMWRKYYDADVGGFNRAALEAKS